MSITIAQEGAHSQVGVSRALTIYHAAQQEEALLAPLAQAEALKVDLSQVAEIDSAGLQLLVEDIRDEALRLRMVQIGETFGRFPRIVRNVAKDLGKEIELQISGADTELDKSMVERIGDPLIHLVRNAMDHGIEPAAIREQRGKPAKGTVRLNAYHDSGSIVIEVGDDGGGLSRERILRKAEEKGLIAPGQALADGEVFKLILEPGFSTAEQVSNISGRGVGMGVVKRNIEALRGSVEIESREGLGTTMRLTLAIIDGFLVEVDEASYVVPLEMVFECVELPADARGHPWAQFHQSARRGAAVPAPARVVRSGHSGPGQGEHRGGGVCGQARRPRRGTPVGRVPDGDQAALEALRQHQGGERVDHPGHRRGRPHPRCRRAASLGQRT
jgi:chemotaxis protein histidine kinase CheA